jgi:hypothetical protein
MTLTVPLGRAPEELDGVALVAGVVVAGELVAGELVAGVLVDGELVAGVLVAGVLADAAWPAADVGERGPPPSATR